MASSEMSESSLKENSDDNDEIASQDDEEMLSLDAEAPENIFPGAKLSSEKIFNHKTDKIGVTPVIIEFRRILQNKGHSNLVPGVKNRDLLHAIVGLYSVSLSEMTPDVLYSTVCDKWARTVLLLRNIKETVSDLEKRKSKQEEASQKTDPHSSHGPAKTDDEEETNASSAKTNDTDIGTAASQDPEAEDEQDVFEEEEGKPGIFHEVFSDTESEGSDDDNEEEDFSVGINGFIETVKKRRERRVSHSGALSLQHVGIENRIIGAITFKKLYCKGERLVHITLVAVRKRFRKWGIGSYLVQQVKDVSVVGPYDAVVVHADNSATEFFERYGFTDDMAINSKWSDLAEQFTNCTLMSFLPPFTGQTRTGSSIPELDIIAMEKEIKKWRKSAVEAYKAEVCCVNRMKHEIVKLRAMVSTQEEIIGNLLREVQSIQKEKFTIEKEYLQHRLMTAKYSLNDEDLADDDDDASVELLIQKLKKHAKVSDVKKFMVTGSTGSEPYCHGQDSQDFYTATKEFYDALKADSAIVDSYEVKMVTKATLPPEYEEAYDQKSQELSSNGGMVIKLYFCGTLENSRRIKDILNNGFSKEDFIFGEYGRGLYFSMYPTKASQFSSLGQLIVGEVSLGNVQTVVQLDPSRTAPDAGFDSLLVPGRLSLTSPGDCEKTAFQEYVIFDLKQVKPLYLVEYSMSHT